MTVTHVQGCTKSSQGSWQTTTPCVANPTLKSLSPVPQLPGNPLCFKGHLDITVTSVTAALVVQYRKLESRPIYLMAKKRLRRVVQEWQAVADAKKASRHQLAAVQLSANHKVMRKAWLSW